MSRLYYPKVVRGGLVGGDNAAFDVAEAGKKIGKLIPVELVTAYAALVSAAMAIRWVSMRQPTFWICFAICFVLTPLYLNKAADPGKPKRNQIIVGTAAFPIWAYLISGNQVIPQFYDAGLATIAAIVFSIITGLIPMNR